MGFVCPSCGYPGLREPPRAAKSEGDSSKGGGGSFEICPSCGFQFGVTDDDEGFTYSQWRTLWKKRGSIWSSRGMAPPSDWNAKSQLASLRAKTGQVRGGKT